MRRLNRKSWSLALLGGKLSSLRTYYTLKLHLFFQSKSTDIFSERVHMPERMLPVSSFTAITLVFVILSVPSTSFCYRDRS